MYKVFRPESVDDSMPPPDDQPGFVMTPTGLYVPVGATWQGVILFDGNGVVLNNATLRGTTTIETGDTLDDAVLTGETVIEDLRLSDTVWDNLRFPAIGINPPGDAFNPVRNTTNGLLEFSASQTNVIAIQAQFPHDWKIGSSIAPHVHWRKKTAGAGNVVWRMEYEFRGIGEDFTDSLTVLNSATPAVGVDDGTALRHLLSSFGSVAMTDYANSGVSIIGIILISRIGEDQADTYDGIAQLLEFDIHYQRDSLGSRSQYNKDSNVE